MIKTFYWTQERHHLDKRLPIQPRSVSCVRKVAIDLEKYPLLFKKKEEEDIHEKY